MEKKMPLLEQFLSPFGTSIPIAHVHDHSLSIACLFFRYIAIKVFFVDKTRLILRFIAIKVLLVYKTYRILGFITIKVLFVY